MGCSSPNLLIDDTKTSRAELPTVVPILLHLLIPIPPFLRISYMSNMILEEFRFRFYTTQPNRIEPWSFLEFEALWVPNSHWINRKSGDGGAEWPRLLITWMGIFVNKAKGGGRGYLWIKRRVAEGWETDTSKLISLATKDPRQLQYLFISFRGAGDLLFRW